VSVKRENVRRTKPTTGARLRPYRVLIVIGIVALAGAIAFAVTWPGFAPKNVTVSGNRIVPSGEIVERAGVAWHVNLWLQDPNAIAKRVETIPYVASATASRRPPSTIAIRVSERTPVAVAVFGNDRVFVDHDLRVLGPAPPESDLPTFVLPLKVAAGPGAFLASDDATAMRNAYAALSAAHVYPQQLAYDRFGGLVATLQQGIVVLFGEDTDLQKKFVLVDPILAQAQREGRRLATVDLRAPNTPVVTYK
jgi:cell division protein FtsQ